MTADEIAAALRLSLIGKCSGGEFGAWLAQREDGSRVVLKWREDRGAALDAVGVRTERLRAKGYPLPRHEAFTVRGAAVLVQEHMPGAVRDEIDHGLVDRVLELNGLQAGEGDDEPGEWGAFLVRTLVEGADGYCLHEPLRAHGPDARAFVELVERIGSQSREMAFPDGDLVHYDFHHRNMLRSGPALTAVVDWDACTSGDRAFDLVTFAFSSVAAECQSGVADRLWREASSRAGGTLVPYVAHMGLRLVDFCLRYHGEKGMRFWLEPAQSRLRSLL